MIVMHCTGHTIDERWIHEISAPFDRDISRVRTCVMRESQARVLPVLADV